MANTAERLMDEVREAADDFNLTLERLKRLKPESAAYYDFLCGALFVKADIVRLKAAHATEEADV